MANIYNYTSVLARQQIELKEQLAGLTVIQRDLGTEKIRQVFKQGSGIVVIQGVRRCGKSIYALSCFEKDYVYVNFDDERLGNIKASNLEALLEACYEITNKGLKNFIFDEIQLVQGWEPFVSRLGRSNNIIVTGSNAHLLSQELGTRLTGRYLPIILYPFSFTEYLRQHEILIGSYQSISASEAGVVRGALNLYLTQGGFPDVKKYGTQYPQAVYGDILQRDIVVRYKVRNAKIFKEFSKVIISNFAQALSLRKLGKIVGLASPNTPAKYAQHLQDAYLCFALSQYFNKLKAQLVTNKKYYIIDSGIIHGVSYTPTQNLGALLENIVFLELLRQRDYYNRFDEIFFWKSDKSEVDFLLRKNKKPLIAIQVCADLSNPLTRDREIKALVEIAENLKVKKFMIISSDQEDELKVNKLNISVWPLYKWLLDPRKSLAEGMK